jgi:uncharacterized protein (TIGR02284 family)
MAVGGVIGAVVGGLAGHAAAEAVNPTAEEAHWRDNYTNEPYYEAGRSFDDYGPAYRHGLEGRTRYEDDWDVAEPRLASEWESARGGSSLNWQQARPASRAAWDRVDAQRAGRADANLTHYGTGLSGTDSTLHTGGDTNAIRSTHGSGRTDMTPSGSSLGEPASTASASVKPTRPTDVYDASASIGSPSAGIGSGLGGDAAMRADMNRDTGMSGGRGTGVGGAAAAVGAAQTAGDNSGDTDDVNDVLNNLIECCKDGEYGFRECAEQAQRQDLKTFFTQRAQDCARGAQELQQLVRGSGEKADDSGSAMGALHRGWVSMKATLSTYDDKAVLEEAERGEDNALARYRKALQKNLPANVRDVVQRQCDGVQRNHDQVKMLRNQARGVA